MNDGKWLNMRVRDVSLEVYSRGSGPLLVYLHPGDGIEPSLPFADALAAHFSVLAPSHPGFGGTALPKEFDAIADLAMFYLDFLDSLDRPAILIGSSFGGWIAAEIAVRNSGKLSGLVLTGAVGIKSGGREARAITDVFSIPANDLPPFLSRNGVTPSHVGISEEASLRIARNRESLTLFGWAPTLYDPKLRHWLHRINVPTLLLWGAEDRIVSPEYGKEFAAAIPGAGFEVLANAGHYVHVDQTAETVKRIARFAVDRK